MKTFEHFPQDDKTKCPVCGTNKDKPCFILPIDGTERNNIVEGLPTHVECICDCLDKFRYNKDLISNVEIIYMCVDQNIKLK